MGRAIRLDQTKAGVRVYYSHADRGHWVECSGNKYFVKTRARALEMFEELVNTQFRRGLYAV